MKTPQDPRHQKRIKLIKSLFAMSFSPGEREFGLLAVKPHLANLDKYISRAAPQWPIDKIAKIDLAILRLACFELAVERREPPKVIIDEAIELAKEFGNDASPSFINGVLGTVINKLDLKIGAQT